MTVTLKRKAKNNLVEVEDILRLARTPSTAHADLLLRLAAEHDWQQAPCFPKVPLATWAETVARFCVGGFDALVDLAADNHRYSFVLGLIEEIPSDQALTAALRIGFSEIMDPEADLERSMKLVTVLNRIGLKKIRTQNTRQVREFLHSLLITGEDEAKSGTVMSALRWYGNTRSIELIRSKPKMSDHWESARRATIRSINQRVKLQ